MKRALTVAVAVVAMASVAVAWWPWRGSVTTNTGPVYTNTSMVSATSRVWVATNSSVQAMHITTFCYNDWLIVTNWITLVVHSPTGQLAELVERLCARGDVCRAKGHRWRAVVETLDEARLQLSAGVSRHRRCQICGKDERLVTRWE